MNIDETEFLVRHRNLEDQMKDLAERDGDAYLPNIRPNGPVDYVFIGMEPSLGRWARSIDDARKNVEAGFRNFSSSIEDFILHFCIRKYLCKSKQMYHLTDVSKGAMPVDRANEDRTARYKSWHQLLLTELELVAKPEAGIFVFGNAVSLHLKQQKFPRSFTQLIHYSPLAGAARRKGIVGLEKEFDEFKKTIVLQDLLDTAELVLATSVSEKIKSETLTRLATKSELKLSQLMLIFNYKHAFDAYKLSKSE